MRIARSVVIACFACLAGSGRTQDAAQETLAVRVDPRVELMSAIFRLAGHREYDQPNSRSPYSAALEEHLAVHREHPVVRMPRRLRRTRGVSYDAVMAIAVHVTDVETLAEITPFDQKPERLDQRWRVDEARAFLAEARKFVERSDFLGFVESRRDFYRAVEERMSAKLAERSYVPWFDAFFGERPTATFVVIPGLLNGGACYGVGTRFPDGREIISPVIGCWTWDEDGLPVFEEGFVPTVVHEFCHSYTNVLVDRFAKELEPAGRRIFATCREVMARQAYGTWKTVMYESLVRASVVRHLADTEGAAAAAAQADDDAKRGFQWVGSLARAMDAYADDRETYPDFVAFMPRVVAFFEAYADQLDELRGEAPRVVRTSPADGDAAVDPGLTTFVVEFDRPMEDGGWSIWGDPKDMPEFSGAPSYDEACKVLTVPIALEPGRTYRLSLNSSRSQNFRSAEGRPLKPVALTFTTRAE